VPKKQRHTARSNVMLALLLGCLDTALRQVQTQTNAQPLHALEREPRSSLDKRFREPSSTPGDTRTWAA
jgi:hypothetical protein